MSAVANVSVDIERPPPAARGWPRQRIVGYVLVGLWILAGLGLIAYLALGWDPELIARYAPSYLSGIGVTLALTAASITIGAALSIPVAYARMSRSWILSGLAYAYVYFFRGTPLIAQTFLVYYGAGSLAPQLKAIGLWEFFREAWYCAVFAFSLNTAAYQAEILRGAIESVPRGQWEGAASLGLHKLQTLWKIILPQALIVALRPYGNEIVLMLKGSAVAALITVYDLLGQTRLAYSGSFDFQTYTWAALIYFALVETLRNIIEVIERWLTRHLIR
jgi:polar amino acid transport system permease protein